MSKHLDCSDFELKKSKKEFSYLSCGKVKHELRVTSSDIRVLSSNPRVRNSNPQVTSSNPRVTSPNPRITSSNPRVRGLKHELKE